MFYTPRSELKFLEATGNNLPTYTFQLPKEEKILLLNLNFSWTEFSGLAAIRPFIRFFNNNGDLLFNLWTLNQTAISATNDYHAAPNIQGTGFVGVGFFQPLPYPLICLEGYFTIKNQDGPGMGKVNSINIYYLTL